MRHLSRTRRRLKWGGLILCGTLSVTFVLSAWMSVEFVSGAHLTGIRSGCLKWVYIPGLSDDHSDDGWYFERRATPYIYWLGEFTLAGPEGWAIEAPIWEVVLGLLVPTALLWVWDRRPRAGCCQKCGYDLTGNVSGMCPERGTSVDARIKRRR